MILREKKQCPVAKSFIIIIIIILYETTDKFKCVVNNISMLHLNFMKYLTFSNFEFNNNNNNDKWQLRLPASLKNSFQSSYRDFLKKDL